MNLKGNDAVVSIHRIYDRIAMSRLTSPGLESLPTMRSLKRSMASRRRCAPELHPNTKTKRTSSGVFQTGLVRHNFAAAGAQPAQVSATLLVNYRTPPTRYWPQSSVVSGIVSCNHYGTVQLPRLC